MEIVQNMMKTANPQIQTFHKHQAGLGGMCEVSQHAVGYTWLVSVVEGIKREGNPSVKLRV